MTEQPPIERVLYHYEFPDGHKFYLVKHEGRSLGEVEWINSTDLTDKDAVDQYEMNDSSEITFQYNPPPADDDVRDEFEDDSVGSNLEVPAFRILSIVRMLKDGNFEVLVDGFPGFVLTDTPAHVPEAMQQAFASGNVRLRKRRLFARALRRLKKSFESCRISAAPSSPSASQAPPEGEGGPATRTRRRPSPQQQAPPISISERVDGWDSVATALRYALRQVSVRKTPRRQDLGLPGVLDADGDAEMQDTQQEEQQEDDEVGEDILVFLIEATRLLSRFLGLFLSLPRFAVGRWMEGTLRPKLTNAWRVALVGSVVPLSAEDESEASQEEGEGEEAQLQQEDTVKPRFDLAPVDLLDTSNVDCLKCFVVGHLDYVAAVCKEKHHNVVFEDLCKKIRTFMNLSDARQNHS